MGVYCASDCPSDFKSFAYYCQKPTGYWRGTGKPEPFPNSEQFGFMYYEKCKAGFQPWGCCNCKVECPEGMKDLTSMCLKKNYQRGAFEPPTCTEEGTEMDQITLKCYPPCEKGIAAGPFCWDKCATGTKPCGGALCIDNDEQCTDDIRSTVSDSIEKIKKNAPKSMPGSPFNVGIVTPSLKYPTCEEGNVIQKPAPSVPLSVPMEIQPQVDQPKSWNDVIAQEEEVVNDTESLNDAFLEADKAATADWMLII